MHRGVYISIWKVKWSRYRPGVAQRVGRGIALLFHDRVTRREWVFSSTPRPHFTPEKDQVPILQEAGWAPGPVWTGGKSRPHWDSIPDRPARSQSLYWATWPTIYVYIAAHAWERSEVRVRETGCGIFPGVDIRWSSWRVVGLKEEELGPLVSIFTARSHERVTDSPIKWGDGRHSDIAVFLDTACIQSCLEIHVAKITTRRDPPNPTESFDIQVKPLRFFPQNLYIL